MKFSTVVHKTFHEYLCDLISNNDRSTTVCTRVSLDSCLSRAPLPSVKFVLINSLNDILFPIDYCLLILLKYQNESQS